MKQLPKREYSLGTRIKRNWQAYVLLTPYTICFFLFTLLPLIVAMVLSFTYFNMLTAPKFVGIENYVRMFTDDDIFIKSIKNTLIVAFVTGPASYLLCYVFAWLINDLPKPLRTITTVVFYAPVLCGQATVIWDYLFSSDAYGFINNLLISFGVISSPIAWTTDTDYAMLVMIIKIFWASLGTGFLSFLAGFKCVDSTLFEAGMIDGIENRIQEAWYITLPSMKPQLVFGAVMQIVTSFTILGSSNAQYATQTLLSHIVDVSSVRYEMGYGCALATILFLFMYFAKKLIMLLLDRVGT